MERGLKNNWIEHLKEFKKKNEDRDVYMTNTNTELQMFIAKMPQLGVFEKQVMKVKWNASIARNKMNKKSCRITSHRSHPYCNPTAAAYGRKAISLREINIYGEITNRSPLSRKAIVFLI